LCDGTQLAEAGALLLRVNVPLEDVMAAYGWVSEEV
jgi:hypothetical protein